MIDVVQVQAGMLLLTLSPVPRHPFSTGAALTEVEAIQLVCSSVRVVSMHCHLRRFAHDCHTKAAAFQRCLLVSRLAGLSAGSVCRKLIFSQKCRKSCDGDDTSSQEQLLAPNEDRDDARSEGSEVLSSWKSTDQLGQDIRRAVSARPKVPAQRTERYLKILVVRHLLVLFKAAVKPTCLTTASSKCSLIARPSGSERCHLKSMHFSQPKLLNCLDVLTALLTAVRWAT